jgi:hypothetical protein
VVEPRRGRLKGGANTEAEAEKLSLSELNLLIAGAEWRFDSVTNSNLRKSAFKRLVWLEAQRERLHGIEAPERKLAARQSDD